MPTAEVSCTGSHSPTPLEQVIPRISTELLRCLSVVQLIDVDEMEVQFDSCLTAKTVVEIRRPFRTLRWTLRHSPDSCSVPNRTRRV